MRAKFLSRSVSYMRDIVIAGHDRDEVTALIFANSEACRTLAGLGPETSDADILRSEPVRAKFQELLRELAKSATGSSNRVVRALLMEEPPSIDKHEVTDKGSFNQGAVLRNRAALVEELYAAEPSPRVISI